MDTKGSITLSADRLVIIRVPTSCDSGESIDSIFYYVKSLLLTLFPDETTRTVSAAVGGLFAYEQKELRGMKIVSDKSNVRIFGISTLYKLI
jgi:hypothetical protein